MDIFLLAIPIDIKKGKIMIKKENVIQYTKIADIDVMNKLNGFPLGISIYSCIMFHEWHWCDDESKDNIEQYIDVIDMSCIYLIDYVINKSFLKKRPLTSAEALLPEEDG